MRSDAIVTGITSIQVILQLCIIHCCIVSHTSDLLRSVPNVFCKSVGYNAVRMWCCHRKSFHHQKLSDFKSPFQAISMTGIGKENKRIEENKDKRRITNIGKARKLWLAKKKKESHTFDWLTLNPKYKCIQIWRHICFSSYLKDLKP